MKILLLPIVTIVSLCGLLKAAPFAMPDKMEDLMANYCFDCHDDETKKGEVRLDNLATLALKDRLDLLNRVQEQSSSRRCPQKSSAERFRAGAAS